MIRRAFAFIRLYFRRRRYLRIQEVVGIERAAGFILDLGSGAASFLADMFPRPEQIILLDIDYKRASMAKRIHPALHIIVADGKHLPLADSSVAMTICNSVIEHVDDQDILAAEICRVSQGYFLQTPYKGFPVETHSFIGLPFYNVMPTKWLRRFMCRMLGANFDYVNSVRYLSEQQLKTLFPEARIIYEKAFGFKKSFYVYLRNEDMK